MSYLYKPTNLGDLQKTIRFSIDTTDTQTSSTDIPANAIITHTFLTITNPYDAGTTIQIGKSGDPDLLQQTTDNNPQAVNTYVVMKDTDWGGANLPVQVLVGGLPAVGDGVVTVIYITNPNS